MNFAKLTSDGVWLECHTAAWMRSDKELDLFRKEATVT